MPFFYWHSGMSLFLTLNPIHIKTISKSSYSPPAYCIIPTNCVFDYAQLRTSISDRLEFHTQNTFTHSKSSSEVHVIPTIFLLILFLPPKLL